MKYKCILPLLLFVLLLQHAVAQMPSADELIMPPRSFYYPTNTWKLLPDNETYLTTTFIADLQRVPNAQYSISIAGHTDDVGESAYNQTLSKQRAAYVRDLLLKHGVPAEKIKVTYYGKAKPESRKIAVSRKKKDVRYANRRVVMIVTKKYSSSRLCMCQLQLQDFAVCSHVK